jgi:Ca2+-binding EF-hand superfamily protein
MKKLMVAALVGAGIVTIPVFAQVNGKDDQAPQAGPATLAAIESRIKAEFAKVDANGDGFVERDEADAHRAKRMAEMRDLHFAALDANKDGSISRAEFDNAHGARPNPAGAGTDRANPGKGHHAMGHGDRRARAMALLGDRMFERADTNKDGKVSLSEALARPTERFKMMDANGDGTVTLKERKAARERRRSEWRQKTG